jgi:hypothetical protein
MTDKELIQAVVDGKTNLLDLPLDKQDVVCKGMLNSEAYIDWKIKNNQEISDKEVLQKAIEIAIENGYKLPSVFGMGEPYDSDRFQVFKGYFSHDFAKAFWGEEDPLNKELVFPEPSKKNYDGKLSEQMWFDEIGKTFIPSNPKCWRGHLQRMVLEENPIDYLRKFIK